MSNTTGSGTPEQAKAIYAILVDICGAHADDPDGFVAAFTSKAPPTEWRFQGALGFGGKFRYPGLTVDCYPEGETAARMGAILVANERLAVLKEPDLLSVRHKAGEFAAQNAKVLASELIEWHDTGLLPHGKLRELAAIWSTMDASGALALG